MLLIKTCKGKIQLVLPFLIFYFTNRVSYTECSLKLVITYCEGKVGERG
jgi:hypothetical protein